jgi:hypothetical protein
MLLAISLNDMNEQLKRYKALLDKYERVLVLGIIVSQRIAGRFVDLKSGWASILFTRLCTTAMSISKLAPKSSSINQSVHWDCVSLSSLTRNLIESYHVFFYFCIEKVSQVEWEFRKLLFDLHDNKNRYEMLKFLGTDQIINYEKIRDELIKQLQNNLFFSKLNQKIQNKYLKGDYAFALSREDIEERMGNDKLAFKGWYKFLSNQTHNFPMSFSRMVEQGKGMGVESEIEVGYSANAIEFSIIYFLEATKQMLEIFPDIKPEFQHKVLKEDTEKSTNAN